ncbi:2,3-diphosphoglycerate-dependent phosphoglycerate mutase [Rhodococcus sp. JVH1]|uniref:2,3-bisphosphoglycerate-dependent phosphoglycerate mutase n=1 Tax=Rhodococcus sp. JVH1 TaxID=745408 RepID=UPI0002721354|nr:2,3-bisphosphoglycerate-dependent phosphoglycerate mutase [Rhodococcus sp. JVH1]EJI95754.1 2,3-bisphosphoglycerate-dependent phosphoglycerate mutase [Rhodococcus sp. JVH1]
MRDKLSPHTLILLRHGQSSANADDAFGGWLDSPLTDRGEAEARTAGALLAAAGLIPETVHASLLTRALDTARIALDAVGGATPPIRRSWRLNERHYGVLQGHSRTAVREEFGDALFTRWRRSYDLAPPAVSFDDPNHPRHDPRYAALPPRELPAAESLADVRRRLVPYWQDAIAGDLAAGRITLVVSHGNSIRAFCTHLDGLSPDEVQALNVPTGVPLRYDLDDALTPLVRGGVYLDPERAAEGIAEVARQGGR